MLTMFPLSEAYCRWNKSKRSSSVIFLFSFLFFSFCENINSQNVESLIAEGDKYTSEFNNQKALEKYLEAEKLSPKNWEICWRISRAYVDIAEHMPNSNEEEKQAQLKTYELSLKYAEKAIQLAPDQSINYVRRAITNGRIALFKGVFSAVGLVKKVKDDLDKAIQLGNGGDVVQSLAHYVYGRTHYSVCEKPYLVRLPIGLGWGDMKKSIEEYNKAIKLRPDFRMYHLDLAKAYIKEKDYKKAKEHLYKIENISVKDEDDEMFLKESKELLASIKDK